MKYFLLLMFTLVFVAAPSGRMNAHRTSISFEIRNQTAHPCGQVTITADEGDTYVTVDANHTYDTDIPSQALSITINGQTIPQGVKAYVHLPDGTTVGVVWTTPSIVAIVDTDVIL
jgi:hypothetical protein